MKKLLAIVLGAAISLPLFGTGTADAAYLSQYDQTISITTSTNLGSSLPDLSDESFQLQEALIGELESSTGLTIDHYYYWIEVDGVKVLAVDPPVAMY